jgi:hypothetical protein
MTENNVSNVDKLQDITAQFVQLGSRFKVLSNLQGGYKLWITTDPDTKIKIFSIDNSYLPSVSRWLYSQNRDEIVNTIVEDINFINKNYKALKPEGCGKLAIFIRRAMPGLRNMKETYKGDPKQEEKITNGISTLNTILGELEKTY